MAGMYQGKQLVRIKRSPTPPPPMGKGALPPDVFPQAPTVLNDNRVRRNDADLHDRPS